MECMRSEEPRNFKFEKNRTRMRGFLEGGEIPDSLEVMYILSEQCNFNTTRLCKIELMRYLSHMIRTAKRPMCMITIINWLRILCC